MQNLYITQKNGILNFKHSPSIYESRGISVEKIIRETVKIYEVKDDFSFCVNTEDQPINGHASTYFFSTINDDYDNCFPCFLFDSWPQIGINNYTDTINNFQYNIPKFIKIGWVGAIGSVSRQIFCQNFANTYFTEAIINHWNRTNPNELFLNCSTYLTMQQQIDRWKYLIDFEGRGYSARTKLLLNSPRITFIADRPYKEFWYKYLVPWRHYIPIKRDLSDLEEKYIKIESDTELQKYILHEQNVFAKKFLSYESALKQTNQIISKHKI
jgi:hypothetical protein